MIRKTITGLAVAVAVLSFVFGRDAVSYVTTSVRWMQGSVKDSVPIEFEIDRARAMVKDLVPDIRKNMHIIAKEEVEIENLDKQIAQLEAKQSRDKEELMRLRADLASGKSSHKYGGRIYTVSQVKEDLNNRFERYKTCDSTLARLRDIKLARNRSLEAARQKLYAMNSARSKLEIDVENLEAQKKMVEVAQTTSDCQFDESRLGQAKELIGDLRGRLQVAEKLAQADVSLQGSIPVEAAKNDDVADQIAEYFAEPGDKPAKPNAEKAAAETPAKPVSNDAPKRAASPRDQQARLTATVELH